MEEKRKEKGFFERIRWCPWLCDSSETQKQGKEQSGIERETITYGVNPYTDRIIVPVGMQKSVIKHMPNLRGVQALTDHVKTEHNIPEHADTNDIVIFVEDEGT